MRRSVSVESLDNLLGHIQAQCKKLKWSGFCSGLLYLKLFQQLSKYERLKEILEAGRKIVAHSEEDQ